MLKFDSNGCKHHHPIAHAERDVAERQVIEILKRAKVTSVMDIGGNAIRHYKYREYLDSMKIWSTCPILSIDDEFKQKSRL